MIFPHLPQSNVIPHPPQTLHFCIYPSDARDGNIGNGRGVTMDRRKEMNEPFIGAHFYAVPPFECYLQLQAGALIFGVNTFSQNSE